MRLFLVTVIVMCASSLGIEAQAVRFDAIATTTNSACAPGANCPLLVTPGTSAFFCTGNFLGNATSAGNVLTSTSGPGFSGASGNIQFNGSTYTIQVVVSPTILVTVQSLGTQSGTYSTLSGCLANPVTTYLTGSAGTSCPTNAQLTPATGGPCTSAADGQGNYGIWTLAGLYFYYLSQPVTAGGRVTGPYALQIGASTGCPSNGTCDANYGTLAAACTAAGVGTLYVTRAWNGLTTATYACAMNFLATGRLQTAAPISTVVQTVTLPCPTAGNFQIFDLSLGGAVAFSSQCQTLPPWQWWGVNTSSSDNSAAASAAIATANNVYAPAGTYNFTGPVVLGKSGQSLTCDNPKTTVLSYTGSSSLIYFHSTLPQLDWMRVSNCQFITGSSSALYAINQEAVITNSTIENNWFTTVGSGTWSSAIRLVAAEITRISKNWFFGGMTTAITLGDGVTATTSITVDHNLIGSLQAGQTGMSLHFCQDCISDTNYYQQAAGFTYAISLDASSDLYETGDNIENDIVPATYGIYNLGILRISGLRATGLFPNLIFNGSSGILTANNILFNGVASNYVVANGGSMSLTNSLLENQDTSIGGGISTGTGRAQIGPGVTVSMLGTGNNGNGFSVDSAAVLHGVTVNLPTGSTGYGIHCASDSTKMGVYIRDFDFENGAGSNSTRFYDSGCGPLFVEANGLVYNGNNTLPDILGRSAIVNSGSNQTIAPLTNVIQITGSGSIQTISPPPQNASTCINILPGAGATWTFAGGGNIFNGSGRTVTVGNTLVMCNYNGTYY
jgi:hypothetical protein